MSEDSDEAPEKWWITPYARSLSDFEFIQEQERDFFRSLPTVEGLAIERQNLGKRLDWMLLLSLFGASVMIAGGLPKDGQFSFFGIEGPNRLISFQLIGVGVAGVFSRYWQTLISMTMLSEMLNKIVGRLVGNANIDFVIARYDANLLWSNLTRQRDFGYQSSWPHWLTALTIPLFGLLIIVLHSGVILYALWLSVTLAINATTPSLFLISLSIASLGIAVLSVFLFVMGFLVPQPFKMSAEMRDHLKAEKALHEANETGAIDLPGLKSLTEEPK